MKSTALVPTTQITEAHVLQACREAAEAGINYATKAVIAGLALLEYREFLGNSSFTGRTCHNGKSSAHGRNQHSDGDGFLAWIDAKGIPQRTAYRWMEAAAAVAMKLLGIRIGEDWSPVIDVEGSAILLSQALTIPEDELPAKALEFRQGLFDFMADKTLAEAVKAVVDGESASSRITRAANGQSEGGSNGEDRKNFVLFGARALKNFIAHVGVSLGKNGGHWQALTPTQQNEVCNYVGLAVQGMPDEMLAYAKDAAAEELRRRKTGGKPEPLALKAALRKKEANKK